MFVRILPCLVLACIAVLAMGASETCAEAEEEAASPTTAAAEEEPAPEPKPGIGDRVTVGSLELTVLSVEPYDAAQHNIFNDGNTRVQVQVRKHKGEEYDFSIFSEFTIIDLAGVGYDADVFCTECPDDVFDLTLYGDTAVQRFVYFEVPDGVVPVSLRYEPGLSFTDAVFIALSPTTAAGITATEEEPATAPAPEPEPKPVIGDRVTVGSLELTVLSVEPYDAAQHNIFNDGNTRVQVQVRKHKGEEYDFSIFSEFTIIDLAGVGYDADVFCTECPDDVFDLTLYGDTAVQRFVYFEVPDGVVPVSLRYEPGLSFTDAVFIALSPTTAAGITATEEEPATAPAPEPEPKPVIGDRVTVGSLELVDPAPGAVSTFGDGTFVVGADIRPGRYRAVDLGAFCSWSRLSGFSGEFDDIIAIEIPQGASALVDIRPTDVGFESSGCGTWSSDLAAVTAGSTAPFGDGTYLVGVDVAPGTWRAPGGEFCTWQRLAGFSGDFGELIAIDIVAGPAIVSIAATDIGFSTTGCGSWTRG